MANEIRDEVTDQAVDPTIDTTSVEPSKLVMPDATAREGGASWGDTFIRGGGYSDEEGQKLMQAASALTKVSNSYPSVTKINQDTVGLIAARRDKRIAAQAANIEAAIPQIGSEALVSFREAFQKNRNDNVRAAAEDILLSNDTVPNKRLRLSTLAQTLLKPQDDVTDYAHDTVQENQRIAVGKAAEAATGAANYVNNSPVGMMKRAIKLWDESSIGLGVVQSFFPSDIRLSNVMDSIGFGNKDIRNSSSGTLEDSFRAWEQEYGSASSPRKREMVEQAISAVNKEANGDKWFAVDAMNRMFAVVTAYNDTGDYRAAEKAGHERGLKGTLVSAIEWGGLAADVGALADAGIVAGKAIKEGAEAVAAVRNATGATTSEAVDVLKVGYAVKKTADASIKKASKVAKETAKTASKASEAANIEPGTAASIDAIINPEKVKAHMLSSFKDDASASASVRYGVDAETSLNIGALPRAADEAIRDIPDISKHLGINKVYDEVISKTVSGAADILRGTGHVFLRSAEAANIAKRSMDELVTAFKDRQFGVVDINKTQQVIVDDGWVTQYVVKGANKSFTAQEAVDAASVYNTEFDDLVRLLKKDEVSGEWKAMPNPRITFDAAGNPKVPANMTGEFAIGLVRHDVYDASVADGANLVMNGHLGSWSTQVDKSAMYAADINDMSTWGEKLRGSLEKVLAESMKNFDSLGGANIWRKRKMQAKVMKVLNSGAGSSGRPGTFYNSDELVDMGLNADEMSAYYSVRARFDAEYFLNNKMARADKVAEGFTREVSLEGHKFFLKPVEGNTISSHKFIANTSGKVVPYNHADTLEDFQVFELSRPINENGVNVKHMLVKASDEWPEGAGYSKMGDSVLPYHAGYIPRMYEAKYIITKVEKVMNEDGTIATFEKAVATAKNYRHAAKFAAENGLKDTDVRLAREAMQSGRGVLDAGGKKRSYNGVIFGRRGEQLADAEIGHVEELPLIDGDRNLKSLSETLATSSGLTSYRQTMEAVINKHIDRWNKAYGADSEYKWNIGTIKAMKEEAKLAHAEKYKEAVAFRDHIAMLQGTDETVMNEALNSFRARLANSAAKGTIRRRLPDKWADTLEEGWRSDMGRDLASRIKNVNFTLFMGLNPATQLVLQSSQVAAYVGLKGGAKYAMSGQYTRDFMALSAGVNLRGLTDNVSKAVYNGLHKAAGMEKDAFDDMVTAFERSGIIQGIDRHQYLDAVLAHSYETSPGVVSGVGHYAGKVVEGLRKVGFNAGETVNQTSAWLFARQRMLASNPELSAKLIDTDEALRKQVVTMGVNIGGNMDNSSRLRHQDGLLGVILQFTSYGTKMSQMMIPRSIRTGSDALDEMYFKSMGRFGSTIYTNREKMFIALTQLGFFGTLGTSVTAISGGNEMGIAGLPMDAANAVIGTDLPGSSFKPGNMGYWLADTWFKDNGLNGGDFPTYARDAITQGFIGASANAIFTDLYDERTNIDWAARFAPVGNLKSAPGRMFEIVNAIALQDYSSVSNFLAGPTMTQFQKASALLQQGGNGAMRTVRALALGYDKPSSVSESVLFFDKLAQLAPALNNWQVGEYAEQTGYFRSTDGSRTVEANGAEPVLRKLFGLRPVEELALTGVKNKMDGHFGESGYGDAEGVQKLANSIWKEMKLAQANLDEGKMTYEEFEDRVAWYTTLGNTTLNEMEQWKLKNLLAEKYNKDALESRGEAFVNAFAKKLTNYDLKYQSAHDILVSMPDFKRKQELLDLVKSYQETYANRYTGEE